MTKADQLRESLITKAKEHWEPNGGFYLTINALISSARAEGAERERERILTQCMGPVRDGDTVITTMPDRPTYLVPVDALAPKEKP